MDGWMDEWDGGDNHICCEANSSLCVPLLSLVSVRVRPEIGDRKRQLPTPGLPVPRFPGSPVPFPPFLQLSIVSILGDEKREISYSTSFFRPRLHPMPSRTNKRAGHLA